MEHQRYSSEEFEFDELILARIREIHNISRPKAKRIYFQAFITPQKMKKRIKKIKERAITTGEKQVLTDVDSRGLIHACKRNNISTDRGKYICSKYGVDFRTGGPGRDRMLRVVSDLIHRSNLSTREIGELNNMSHQAVSQIYKKCKKLDIPVVNRTGRNKTREGTKWKAK